MFTVSPTKNSLKCSSKTVGRAGTRGHEIKATIETEAYRFISVTHISVLTHSQYCSSAWAFGEHAPFQM